MLIYCPQFPNLVTVSWLQRISGEIKANQKQQNIFEQIKINIWGKQSILFNLSYKACQRLVVFLSSISTDDKLTAYSFPHQKLTISPYFSCSSIKYSWTLPAFAMSGKLPLLQKQKNKNASKGMKLTFSRNHLAPILKGISVSHQEKRERNSVTTLLYFRFNLGMDFTPNSFRSRHSLLTQDLKVLLLEYMDLWMNSSVKCKNH